MSATDPSTWLDLRDIAWQADAECRNADPEAWFPERGGYTGRRAQRVCLGCPVRVECLNYSLTIDGLAGIWGGLNESERMSERRRRGLTIATGNVKPCGTRAAYDRHRRNGETPCGPCTAAAREYNERDWLRRSS